MAVVLVLVVVVGDVVELAWVIMTMTFRESVTFGTLLSGPSVVFPWLFLSFLVQETFFSSHYLQALVTW